MTLTQSPSSDVRRSCAFTSRGREQPAGLPGEAGPVNPIHSMGCCHGSNPNCNLDGSEQKQLSAVAVGQDREQQSDSLC